MKGSCKHRIKIQTKLPNFLTMFSDCDSVEVLPTSKRYPLLCELERRGFVAGIPTGEQVRFTITSRGDYALTNIHLLQLAKQ